MNFLRSSLAAATPCPLPAHLLAREHKLGEREHVRREELTVAVEVAEHAIRGMQGVSLLLEETAPTAAILTGVFGFVRGATEGTTTRFTAPGGGLGDVIDLREAGGFLPARPGRGSVHHIAFRATDDADQARMAALLAANHGLQPTEQRDRNYFRSVYFREPGGVLFEIATDAPGFAVDEPAESLGQALKLPEAYEAHRARIEAALPALD